MIRQLKDGSWQGDARKVTKSGTGTPQILLLRDAVKVGDRYTITVSADGRKIILERAE
jgi:hypothetical protein